ncbi:MAG: leucine-rich repeat domain-containing protein [Ruminococcus sp.]|nr:leucine-rich repeat domain-containing protein [Ruminococcus sp.]
MKKIIFTAILSALMLSAFSCGNVTGSVKEESETPAVENQVTEKPDTENLDPQDMDAWLAIGERPTEEERDIVSSESFEYEIKDGNAVVTKYIGTDKDVIVPDKLGDAPVTEIGYYAFEAKYDITSVQLPESITLICEGAFMDCHSMAYINIPEAVTGIERGAFVACTSLTELTVPANVTFIQEEAFTACEGLQTLTINNPDLTYESWGLEDLPNLTVIAPEGSTVAQWASEMGKTASQDRDAQDWDSQGWEY